MSLKNIIEENGETIIGTWTLNCIPFDSGRFLGKLHVTQEHLYFDAQFDSSISGLFEQVAVSTIAAAGHALLVGPEIAEQWKNKGYMSINKKDISSVSEKSSFFKKTVIITLKDDNKVVFDYGMLGVKKLAEAIKS